MIVGLCEFELSESRGENGHGKQLAAISISALFRTRTLVTGKLSVLGAAKDRQECWLASCMLQVPRAHLTEEGATASASSESACPSPGAARLNASTGCCGYSEVLNPDGLQILLKSILWFRMNEADRGPRASTKR